MDDRQSSSSSFRTDSEVAALRNYNPKRRVGLLLREQVNKNRKKRNERADLQALRRALTELLLPLLQDLEGRLTARCQALQQTAQTQAALADGVTQSMTQMVQIMTNHEQFVIQQQSNRKLNDTEHDTERGGDDDDDGTSHEFIPSVRIVDNQQHNGQESTITTETTSMSSSFDARVVETMNQELRTTLLGLASLAEQRAAELHEQGVIYLQTWQTTITDRCQTELHKTDQLRRNVDHYQAKVASLKEDIQKNSKQKKEQALELKLQRNQTKLYAAETEYQRAAREAVLLLEELVARAWRDLYPILHLVLQSEYEQHQPPTTPQSSPRSDNDNDNDNSAARSGGPRPLGPLLIAWQEWSVAWRIPARGRLDFIGPATAQELSAAHSSNQPNGPTSPVLETTKARAQKDDLFPAEASNAFPTNEPRQAQPTDTTSADWNHNATNGRRDFDDDDDDDATHFFEFPGPDDVDDNTKKNANSELDQVGDESDNNFTLREDDDDPLLVGTRVRLVGLSIDHPLFEYNYQTGQVATPPSNTMIPDSSRLVTLQLLESSGYIVQEIPVENLEAVEEPRVQEVDPNEENDNSAEATADHKDETIQQPSHINTFDDDPGGPPGPPPRSLEPPESEEASSSQFDDDNDGGVPPAPSSEPPLPPPPASEPPLPPPPSSEPPLPPPPDSMPPPPPPPHSAANADSEAKALELQAQIDELLKEKEHEKELQAKIDMLLEEKEIDMLRQADDQEKENKLQAKIDQLLEEKEADKLRRVEDEQQRESELQAKIDELLEEKEADKLRWEGERQRENAMQAKIDRLLEENEAIKMHQEGNGQQENALQEKIDELVKEKEEAEKKARLMMEKEAEKEARDGEREQEMREMQVKIVELLVKEEEAKKKASTVVEREQALQAKIEQLQKERELEVLWKEEDAKKKAAADLEREEQLRAKIDELEKEKTMFDFKMQVMIDEREKEKEADQKALEDIRKELEQQAKINQILKEKEADKSALDELKREMQSLALRVESSSNDKDRSAAPAVEKRTDTADNGIVNKDRRVVSLDNNQPPLSPRAFADVSASPESNTPAEELPFPPGTRVILNNVAQNPALNGTKGVVKEIPKGSKARTMRIVQFRRKVGDMVETHTIPAPMAYLQLYSETEVSDKAKRRSSSKKMPKPSSSSAASSEKSKPKKSEKKSPEKKAKKAKKKASV